MFYKRARYILGELDQNIGMENWPIHLGLNHYQTLFHFGMIDPYRFPSGSIYYIS